MDGYASGDELLDDLQLVADSLFQHRGVHAGAYAVERLVCRVRSFGFHLARLDVRQDSRVHDDALAALLADPDWVTRGSTARADRLRPYASGEAAFAHSADANAESLQAVFATLRDSRRSHGHDAIGLYIISMARSAADVLAVLALARRGGLVDEAQHVPLNIAPLFETVDDLKNAPATLRALLDDPVYRRHLAARDDQQWVMLGYSDSGKDGGTLASRWGLQRAQVELLDVAHAAGIHLAFFHGRGGSASRGGARITPALMSSPRGAVAGVLRVTEQGEVIHRKYGIRALALRNLEQTVGAVLRASLRPLEIEPREERWRELMDTLSATSRQSYRDFVERDGFVDYFRSATPIDVIEQMTLGSRPASRRSMRGVQDLRAIPWVFAWTQCRSILPGWYGLGSALEQGVQQFGEAGAGGDGARLAVLLQPAGRRGDGAGQVRPGHRRGVLETVRPAARRILRPDPRRVRTHPPLVAAAQGRRRAAAGRSATGRLDPPAQPLCRSDEPVAGGSAAALARRRRRRRRLAASAGRLRQRRLARLAEHRLIRPV